MNKQKLIQYLLEIRANDEYIWLLDKLTHDDDMLLGWASRDGHINIVKYLVKNGCNSTNELPLIFASLYGHIDIVKYLVENGCDPNNELALFLASGNGYYEIVEYLKNEQTKTNTTSS